MIKIFFIKLFVLFVFIVQGRQLNKELITSYSIYDSLFKSQDWRKTMDPEMVPIFGNNWKKEKILEIGDQLKIDVLGEKIINDSGAARLSDYKGKLVILDLWATWCGSCMAKLPHMEELQKQFKNKIQIILVNFWEDEDEVREQLNEMNRTIDLPIILGRKELKASSPCRFIPYHVWIDSQGIIRAQGPAINTYKEKIDSILNGKEISILKDESLTPEFVPSLPYYKVLKMDIGRKDSFSFFAPFNPEYAPIIGGKLNYFIDSSLSAHRISFVNRSVFDLFAYAYADNLRIRNIILSPYVSNIYLEIKDTTLVTDRFNLLGKTDQIHIKNRFCYEQVAPLHWTEQMMIQKMKADLVKYFENKLSIIVSLEKKTISVKALHRMARNEEALRLIPHKSIKDKDTIDLNGKRGIYFRDISVVEALKSSSNVWDAVIDKYKLFYCIDELENRKEDFVILPLQASFEEIENVLESQGFGFIDKNMEIPQLVVRLKSEQKSSHLIK